MKFKHKKVKKFPFHKLIVLISAFSIILSTIPFALVSADTYQPAYSVSENCGVEDYKVTKAVPAIPVYTDTKVDKYYLEFEFEDDQFIEGTEVTLELAEEVSTDKLEILDGNIISAKQKGIYKVNVKYDSKVMTVYIIVRAADDTAWYIYDEDFTATNYNATSYSDIAIPDGWKSQYAQNTTSKTLGDFTHVGKYPENSGITSGIIPFYDTYNLTDGSKSVQAQMGGVFTLNNSVVKDFRDYTISMESMIYNHYNGIQYNGIGLFGRAPVNADGKIYDGSAKERFTIFSVNNGCKNDGSTGSYSGQVWRMTVGDGYYKQNQTNMGKVTNISMSTYNSGVAVSVPMSLKYEGTTATYTVADKTYTVNLNNVSDDTPLEKGAVGVSGYRIGDGTKNLENFVSIQRFSVALNNGVNDCPAYKKEYPASYQPTDTQGVVDYKVKKSAPAIPMYEDSVLDKYYLEFEMETGVYTEGQKVSIELDDSVTSDEIELTKDGTVVNAKKKGIYKANICYGTKIMSVYIIVRGEDDEAWYIYDEDFTQGGYNPSSYTEIAIPDGWKSQYAQNYMSTTLGDFTHVGKYPESSNVSSGIVPFYDTYNLTDGSSNITSQRAGIFTLNNATVNDFRDYTISMESMVYNHWPNNDYHGIALFGRAPVNADGKIYNGSAKERFTVFGVNNAYTNSGGSGTKSGDMWYVTLGDGFYEQQKGVLGKATNINKSINNTGVAVSVPMSLKYDGATATYQTGDSSYSIDLNTVNDDTPLDRGAVGVAGYGISDGNKYLDVFVSIQRFSVALNNGDNDCPAYYKEHPAAYQPVSDKGTIDYKVSKESPAIPMYVNTTLDKYYLEFEMSDGVYTEGANVSIEFEDSVTSDEIELDSDGTLIKAKKKGVYKANICYGTKIMSVYIIVRGEDDEAWYIYDEDFTQSDYNATSYSNIAIPDGWKSQYAQNSISTTLGDFTHVGKYPENSNITSGIIPFYDTYNLTDGSSTVTAQKAGIFTLNNDIVNDFRDYTISMESMVYNHWPNNNYHGIALFGRAPVNSDGKIYNGSAKERFTVFGVNNAYTKTGDSGSNSGDIWYITLGDGYYEQQKGVLGKAANINKALNNTGAAVSVPMSLKYDGATATYKTGDSSYSIDLNTVNDDTPLDRGAVGVAGYGIGDGNKYLDVFVSIQRFSVALNNSDNNCPAYVDGLEVGGNLGDDEEEVVVDAAYDWVEGQGVNGYYTVTKAAPAIPMIKGATLDKAYLKFEFDTEYVYGNDTTITLADPDETGILIDGDFIIAQKKGNYLVKVSDGENEREVYVVVRGSNDTKWYLYNHDFTKEDYNPTAYDGEGSIPVPEEWASQYADTMNYKTLKDFLTVGMYPSDGVISTGLVPFYDTYHIGEGRNRGGLFTLNDPVVNAFSDYTINMDAVVYNHWPDYNNYGIGIYGRAQLDSNGKIADLSTDDRFTVFAVNNAYTKSGSAGSKSGEVFTVTLGDGFTSYKNDILGKADVNKALNNSNDPVSVPMSLKLDGAIATYTAGKSSFRYDLSTANNPSGYNDAGAVGVFGYGISDNSKYYDVWTAINTFSVSLNNSANNCPAYIVESARGIYDPVEDQGQVGYLVTKAAPAIPMLTNTSLDITYISAEMEEDTVDGVDLTITLVGDPDGVTVDGKVISATQKGVYEAKLSDGSYERTVYIVVKKQNEDYWYIYDENFAFKNYNAKNYSDIPIPSHWKSQYATNTLSTTLSDFTHVGTYPAGITSGIVPFYDTYNLTGTVKSPPDYGTTFTLNDSVVNEFSDYTISMDSMLYGHWSDYANSGVGLFGRAQIDSDGKLANLSGSDRFTAFLVNNAYNKGGEAGSASGKVWYMTIGDGFYKQASSELGKATDINKSIVNTATPVSVPMSLKYEGRTATYKVGENSEFTCDLSGVSDNNYTENGAVGVLGYCMADGNSGLENMLVIKRFSVKLNNDKDTLPAYRIDVEETSGAYNYAAVEGQGETDYLVTEASPAIPMNVGTSVDIKYLDFEIGGKRVDGNGAIVILKDSDTDGIVVTEELITATKTGVYPAFVEVGGNFIEVFIVVKHQKDDTWYLYNEDFTDCQTTDSYNKLAIPEGWKSQYGHDMFVTELHDLNYLAPLSYTSNVKTGIIPIYDPKKAGDDFASRTAFFSLNNSVVNAFADYTITSKAYVYSNQPNFTRTGIGLYGRAELNAEGKYVNQGNAAGFTTFSINPAVKSDGNGDEYSGKVFAAVYAAGGWLQSDYVYLPDRAEGVNYSRAGSNVGVKMTMSLKYDGKYALYTVGDSTYKYDLTSSKNELGNMADINYLNKGSVGVSVHSASNGDAFGAWTAIQYFSVALNNSVEGNYKAANLNCPAYRVDFVDKEVTPKDNWNVGEGEEIKIVSTVDDNERHDPPGKLETPEEEESNSTVKRIIKSGTPQEVLFILLIGGIGLFILLGIGIAAIIIVNNVTKVRRY